MSTKDLSLHVLGQKGHGIKVAMTIQDLPCTLWDRKEHFDLGVKWLHV